MKELFVVTVTIFLVVTTTIGQPNSRVADWTRGGNRYVQLDVTDRSLYFAALPTMQESRNGNGDVVNGFYMFKRDAGLKILSTRAVTDDSEWDTADLFEKSHNYARSIGYASGFPTFEYTYDNLGRRRLFIVILSTTSASTTRKTAREIGVSDSDLDNVGKRFQIFSDKLQRTGYIVIPNYSDVTTSFGVAYGITYVKEEVINVKDIPRYQFYHLFRFRYAFDSAVVSTETVNALMASHLYVTKVLDACSFITREQRANLKELYLSDQVFHRDIFYDPHSSAYVRAKAYNIGKIMPNLEVENTYSEGYCIDINMHYVLTHNKDLRAVLIHEMMHLAGYEHTTYSSGNIDCSPSGLRRPFFRDPPVKAQCCVSGYTPANNL